MTTYAIGSVKGNYRLLVKLLEKIQFDPDNDCLWFTGNLVNEGPESLAVLRLVKDLGKKSRYGVGQSGVALVGISGRF